MALWACGTCGTAYAVGAPACPQCGSTDHQEDSMPKITAGGGPSNALGADPDAPSVQEPGESPFPETPADTPDPDPAPQLNSGEFSDPAELDEGGEQPSAPTLTSLTSPASSTAKGVSPPAS